MQISEVSKRFDLTKDTLRYYERVGLIPEIKRNSSGNRDYKEEDCNWIEFIKYMRDAGLSINTLIEYLKLYQEGDSTIKERKELLTEERDKLAEKINKIGLIILISDLYDEPEEILSALKHFRYLGHEVIVFQILDKNEIEFNFDRQTKFLDMENNHSLITESRHIRDSYRKSLQKFLEKIKTQCLNNNIDYKLLMTDTPLNIGLMEYLNKRAKML